VWTPSPQSPYLDAQRVLMERAIGLDPKVFNQACPPGGTAELANSAATAGWGDVVGKVVEHVVSFPSFHQYVIDHLRALPWSAPFFNLDRDIQANELSQLRSSLSAYIGEDDVAHIPTTSLLLTATAS
jgi:hypothetical protein